MTTNQSLLNGLEILLLAKKVGPCPDCQDRHEHGVLAATIVSFPEGGSYCKLCLEPLESGRVGAITDPKMQAAWVEVSGVQTFVNHIRKQFPSFELPDYMYRGLLEQVVPTLWPSNELLPEVFIEHGDWQVTSYPHYEFRWWGDAASLATAIMEALK